MINPFRGLVLGFQLAVHPREVEFCGPCTCGHCGLWKVFFRGRAVHLPEETYDKLRYLQAIWPWGTRG